MWGRSTSAVMSVSIGAVPGRRCGGMGEGHYVTLDCATHFIAAANRLALDAVVRWTKPRWSVSVGHCEPDVRTTQLNGTLKRIRERHDRAVGPVTALVAAAISSPTPPRPKAVAALDASPLLDKTSALLSRCSPSRAPVRSLLWGGVGRGK